MPLLREVNHVRARPPSGYSAALNQEIALFTQMGNDAKTSLGTVYSITVC